MIDSPTATLTESQQRALDNLPPRVAAALSHFCEALLARFPAQIRRIILYGSFARGDYHEESDVDVMVVVGWEEERLPGGWYRSPYCDPRWQTIIDLATDATLECERYVSALVISETLFQSSIGDAAEEARREGVELYSYRPGTTPDAKIIATRAHADEDWRPAPGRVIRERDSTDSYGAETADLSDPRLWLSLADEKLQIARELSNAAHYNDAISRVYYAMFYAAKAALLSIGVTVKSHTGAISQFGKYFVKTGRIDKRYEAMLSRANEDRLRSDYRPKSRAQKDDAERALRDAEAFIAKARELVEEELSKRGASPS